MSEHGPSPFPCVSCPYRRDVPSGVWASSEYAKLPGYDRETPFQPAGAFFCHQENGHLCSGWCGTHEMRDSLGLRLAVSMGVIDGASFDAAIDYVCPVPLFDSGAEAAAHGLRDLAAPSTDAERVMDKLEARRSRRGSAG